MRAIVLKVPAGTHQKMEVGEIDAPEPGPGQVRVKVAVAGLNPVDYKLARQNNAQWQWPRVFGVDAAGTVESVGPDVAELKVGEQVFYHSNMHGQGTFAELHVTPAHTAARVPEGVTLEQAAALPCAGYTAWTALNDRLKVAPGQTLLVLGAAGGVGGFAVQLGKLAGCRVIGTCSAASSERVKGLGAEATIDYEKEDIPARVRELTEGRGVDAAIDAVSAASATTALQMLTFNGQLASVVGRPDLTALPAFSTAPSLHEVALGAVYGHGTHEQQAHLAEMGDRLAALVKDGTLDAMVAKVVAFEEIPAGLEELAGRHVHGKIVARVG